MVQKMHTFIKKIVVILSILMVLTSFAVSPIVEAASQKTKMTDGFYYSGTTEGTYVVSESIMDWLINTLAEIVDFLLGIMTMGGRMVFVGWAALIEELITFSLEATTGIPMDIENNVNTTAIDGVISSSNNLTLEAIVFNQVPILNVNVFENNKIGCVSGTGNFFVVCEDCYNTQEAEKAAKAAEEDEDDGRTSNPYADTEEENMYAPTETNVVGKNEKICEMEECTCTQCWDYLNKAGYLETDESGNYKLDPDTGFPIRKGNAITVIKDSVSKWYYILRLIAIAGMLISLIVIGIKIASTSIASDKALYKRMLMDWVVGMVLLFAIHYYMIGVIYFNETFLDFIKDADQDVAEVVKKEFYIDDKDNNYYEIGLYQAVRTRAYDPKLINGTTGTVMYITLVFTTMRFLVIYLKRYLTMIILTVSAPGIAFSYAIQKVLSGKSKAFSKWMGEYFMNIFIQVVHALIYILFVSTALRISLDSISGMIIAFIFMNFMLKADDIFRKIFKMNSNSIGDMMKPESAKALMNSAKSAAAFMTAGNLLRKSPVTKAVTAPVKALGTEALLFASRKKREIDEKEENVRKREDKAQEETAQLNDLYEQLQAFRQKIDPNGKATKDFEAFSSFHKKGDPIGEDGKTAIQQELSALEVLAANKKLSQEEIEELQGLRERTDKLTEFSFGDVVKAHVGKLLDYDNYYEYDARVGKYVRKSKHYVYDKDTDEYKKKRKKAYYDVQQNKWVRESINKLVAEQLSAKNFLGLTDEDKKLVKETLGVGKDALVGLGSLFVGLGTVVTNPAAGLGLLATGVNSSISYFDKIGALDSNREYRLPAVSEKNKRFSFNRFNQGATQNITRSILANADQEKDTMIVENVRKNHKTLYTALTIGGIGLIVSGAVGLGPAVTTAGFVARVAGNNIQRFSGYSQRSMFGKISRHHFKQMKKLKSELVKDEIHLLAAQETLKIEDNYAKVVDLLETEIPDASDVPEEQVKFEQALALKRDEALELESGEILQLNTPTIDVKNMFDSSGYIKDDIAQTIIEQAVAKTIVDKALKEQNLQAFDVDEIKVGAKEQITQKLRAMEVLTKDDKIEKLIKDLDTKVTKSAETVIAKEINGLGEPEQPNLTPNPAGEASPVADVKLSAFDQAIIEVVVREKVASGEIKKIGDLSQTMIMDAVNTKRVAILERKSTDDVIKMMQAAKQGETQSQVKGPLEQITQMSAEKEQAFKKGISQLKTKNKPEAPKTEEERRKDKKKRIKELDDILMAAAQGEENVTDSTNDQVYKSVDEVLEELFGKMEDRKQAYELIENVKNMRRLNKRGEHAKMQTDSGAYHRAKGQEKRRKAFTEHPDLISTGDREYTNGDGRKDLSKEIYGPVTDIVSLIKGISSNQKS